MKFFSLPCLSLLATLAIATSAIQATESPASKSVAPSAAPAIVTLGKSDKLPEKVTDLISIERSVGEGLIAQQGHPVMVHYTGWLYDPAKPEGKGTKFDSSLDTGIPFGFIIGSGKVIRGWSLGVPGMKPGGKRTIIIPPALAYGERAISSVIPANATLLFDIELVDIVNPKPAVLSPK